MKKMFIIASLLVSINGFVRAGRVDITDLDKADLLRELYAAAEPMGPEEDTLTDQEVTQALSTGKIIDLNGRVMNINLSGNKVETSPYNKHNGTGLAEKIIKELGSKITKKDLTNLDAMINSLINNSLVKPN